METKKVFEEAKKADLVTLLATQGHLPDKISRQDYWYKSPFREEQTASFKINRERNIWFDHGEGIGGNIIDFAVRFFFCDPQTAATRIIGLTKGTHFSFHQPPSCNSPFASEKKERTDSKITILNTRPLQNVTLLRYLEDRRIPLKIAALYCKEVDFLLNGKKQFAIGFQNKSGGFELRNQLFKGSSSPKDITYFDNGKQEISIFEGFFDFLSFLVIRPQAGAGRINCLVLNSLAFFEKSRSLMEQYDKIYLFLDQGRSGRNSTRKAQEWNKAIKSEKYIDCSSFYKYREDLNAWLVAQPKQLKHHQQQSKRGRRL